MNGHRINGLRTIGRRIAGERTIGDTIHGDSARGPRIRGDKRRGPEVKIIDQLLSHYRLLKCLKTNASAQRAFMDIKRISALIMSDLCQFLLLVLPRSEDNPNGIK